jgi:hypothetical protein
VPSLEDLLETPLECPPPPRQRPAFAYDLLLQVPGDSLTPLERLWQPGDRVELQVREGIVDAPRGGACAIWRARTLRPGSAESVSAWTPSQLSTADCLPVPEPTFAAGLLAGVLWAIVVYEVGRWLREIGRRYPPADRSTWNDDEPDDLLM